MSRLRDAARRLRRTVLATPGVRVVLLAIRNAEPLRTKKKPAP